MWLDMLAVWSSKWNEENIIIGKIENWTQKHKIEAIFYGNLIISVWIELLNGKHSKSSQQHGLNIIICYICY